MLGIKLIAVLPLTLHDDMIETFSWQWFAFNDNVS